jgi:hypothetical protein
MLVGDIPTAYGVSPWVSLAVATGILFLALRLLGRRTDLAAEIPEEADQAAALEGV